MKNEIFQYINIIYFNSGKRRFASVHQASGKRKEDQRLEQDVGQFKPGL